MKLEGRGSWDCHHETHLFKTINCYTSFFTNKTYAGIRKCGELEVSNAHTAYVTVEEYAQVQRERAPQRVKSAETGSATHPTRRKPNSPFLLSGIMRCGYCEYMMVGSGKADQKWYRCGMKPRAGAESCVQKSISAYHLHAMLAEYLQREVFTFKQLKGWRDQIADLIDHGRNDLSAQRKGLQKQREVLSRKIENIINTLEDHPSNELAERLTARRNELAGVEADIARVTRYLAEQRGGTDRPRTPRRS